MIHPANWPRASWGNSADKERSRWRTRRFRTSLPFRARAAPLAHSCTAELSSRLREKGFPLFVVDFVISRFSNLSPSFRSRPPRGPVVMSIASRFNICSLHFEHVSIQSIHKLIKFNINISRFAFGSDYISVCTLATFYYEPFQASGKDLVAHDFTSAKERGT